MTASTDPARKKATYADIEALPPNMVGEILAGELVAHPRPAGPHSTAASTLGAILSSAFHIGVTGPGGWWILHEPELSLGVDADFDPVVPDIAGWRLTSMPDRPMGAQFHIVPDWLCEVLSPSTARHDRMLKLPFYARAGVGHVWLVDPILETVEVYRNDGGHWLLAATAAGDLVTRLEPFDAVDVDLLPLWGRRREAEAG